MLLTLGGLLFTLLPFNKFFNLGQGLIGKLGMFTLNISIILIPTYMMHNKLITHIQEAKQKIYE